MRLLAVLFLSHSITSNWSCAFLSPAINVINPIHTLTKRTQQVPRAVQVHLFDSLLGKSDAGGELAFFTRPADESKAVAEYIKQWAMTLQDSSKLTTPVEIVPIDSGAQILFRPKESTYKSREEEQAAEKGDLGEGDKGAPVKQGGIEVVVDDAGNILARRCEMEEGTMIREMSEKFIIDSLKAAMAVWKKDL